MCRCPRRILRVASGTDSDRYPGHVRCKAESQTQCIARHDVCQKRSCIFFLPWEPFPEFRDPNSAEWRLMEAIIRRLKQSGEIVQSSSCRLSTTIMCATACPADTGTDSGRLGRSLGIHVIDLLPHLQKLGVDAFAASRRPMTCTSRPMDISWLLTRSKWS